LKPLKLGGVLASTWADRLYKIVPQKETLAKLLAKELEELSVRVHDAESIETLLK
jgi:hypothetical protein